MKPRCAIPLLEIDEVLNILNSIALFAGLNDKLLYELFRHLEEVNYAKGEFIFEPGDQPSDIYIIWQGEAELYLNAGGTYLIKGLFTLGQCFGETAVIGVQPHTAGVLARSDCRLIVLPKTALFGFFDSYPELFSILILNIAREACRRLGQADQTLLHYIADSSKHP